MAPQEQTAAIICVKCHAVVYFVVGSTVVICEPCDVEIDVKWYVDPMFVTLGGAGSPALRNRH